MKLASQIRSLDLFDADGLTGEDLAEIDLLALVADAAAGGDENVPLVEGYSSSGRPSQAFEEAM